MLLDSRDERLLLLDANERIIADSDPQGEPVRLLPASLDKGAPILVDGQRVGTLIFASGLGRLTRYQDTFLRQVNGLMLVAAVVAVLAVLVVSGFQARRIVAPVRTLAEAGELQMETEPVEMGSLIRDVVNRVRGAACTKGITLGTWLPDTPLPVTGDAQRLTQVLLNLLSNALQHTPPDGQITVSARQVGEHEMHVTVQDTGEGISAKDLPHIFERFYRTDRARSRDTGGSGLGLSITRSLVEAHGGRIWAHSTKEGSALTFALPLAVADIPESPKDALQV